MGDSYANCLTHYVFSTKGREQLLEPGLRQKMFEYMSGLSRNKGNRLIKAGGITDHVHLLVSLHPTVSVATAIKELKAISSKWVHETYPEYLGFSWQAGYGAFSVSQSQISNVIDYIERQEEHHRKITFEEEFVSFLKKNNIPYDERYLLG